MFDGGPQSLLNYLDVPVVIGDLEGGAVYANSCFLNLFRLTLDDVTGRPLSVLFDGGARERILMAVAEVCEHGVSTRFRVREKGISFIATASPIAVGNEVVGVVILLNECADDERLLTLVRDLEIPVMDIARNLTELREQTGGRRAEEYSYMVEKSVHALEQMQGYLVDLKEVVRHALERTADRSAHLQLDVVQMLRTVAEHAEAVSRKFGIKFELVVPAQLPELSSEALRLQEALIELVDERIRQVPQGAWFTLAAKVVGKAERASLQIELTDTALSDTTKKADLRLPRTLLDVTERCNASVRTSADPIAGHTISIRFPLTEDE